MTEQTDNKETSNQQTNENQQPNEDQPSVSLEDLASFFTEQIGPDKEAIERFLWKETDKFELINLRLNELLILLESVVTSKQFGNPNELCSHLQNVFSSIDAICSFVYDVKNRLTLLEKEVDKRKPNKLLGFMKKVTRRNDQPIDVNSVIFDTDALMNQYGISFPETEKKSQENPTDNQTNQPTETAQQNQT